MGVKIDWSGDTDSGSLPGSRLFEANTRPVIANGCGHRREAGGAD